MTISFFVPGTPVAQPRVKATARGGKTRVYTPDKKVGPYKKAIKEAYAETGSKKTSKPVSVFIQFFIPAAKGSRKKAIIETCEHAKRPDLDNLCKAVLDALTDAGAWEDDSQVFHLDLCKYYVHKETRVGTHVAILESK